MNNDELWLLQLWSGAIGSFVAAVLGGLVALLVVRLTNGQQRRQAELSREIDAMAEFTARCASVSGVFSEAAIPDPQKTFVSLEVALVRLQMSSKDMAPVARVLGSWPVALTTLTTYSRTEETRQDEFSKEIEDAVLNAAASVSGVFSEWPSANAEKRRIALETLQVRTDALEDFRLRLQQAAEEYRATELRADNPGGAQ
jgi:hypothetical protein